MTVIVQSNASVSITKRNVSVLKYTTVFSILAFMHLKAEIVIMGCGYVLTCMREAVFSE